MMTERACAQLKIENHYPDALLRLENREWVVIDGKKELGPRRATPDEALIAAADLIVEPTNRLVYSCGCSYPTTEPSARYDHLCAPCYRCAIEGDRAARVIHEALAIE
jgi:hypothetical protein